MEDISVVKRKGTATVRNSRSSVKVAKSTREAVRKEAAPDKLSAEVDENFLNYLNWHGLAKEDNLLVLSSNKHYYYDYEELKDVTTLINVKQLNLVKHLDDFLHTLYDGLAPRTNFVGCFADRKSQKENNMARLYRRMINFLDAKIEVEIDRKNFSRLLESHGFKVIDMTEINGLTYFRTQNHRMASAS
jgi:hypothetical protein